MMDRGQPNGECGADVLSLAEAYVHGDLSDEMVVRLDQLLRTDPEARQQYVDYLLDSYHLHSLAMHAFAGEANDELEATEELEGTVPFLLTRESGQSLPSGVWPSTVGFFSQGMPLAYLLAAVICGIGFLVGSLVHVSTPVQVVREAVSSPSSPGQRSSVGMQFVGRITGMVDCRWADPDTAAIGCVAVPLGRKYSLASGLMEIVYDTGARVILQGPATYEVDSRNGGFLSVGRLTARVEKGGVVRSTEYGVRSEERDDKAETQSLAIGDQKLFAVRTPTATVTDLGTEFGVEVADDGVCEVHVLEGRVKAEWAAAAGGRGGEMLLIADQAARLDPARPNQTSITADTGRFRNMRAGLVRTPPLLWPILDKTFVAWVSLDNLEQQGVGVLSVVNMPEWDGIVFGELARGKWMAGSHGYYRTQETQAGYPAENATPGELVQIAIVYNWTRITIYRNGVKYAEYDVGNRQVFKKDSILLMGKRHLPNETSVLPTLAGAIEEARFYNIAMPAEMIAKLKLGEPSPIRPVGQWTFEDGTARDVTGHFPMGELQGNARINDGKLILDGIDGFLLVPAVEQSSASSNAKRGGQE